MIAHTLRGPHNLYRRYQGLLEQTLTVSALALLVILSLDSLPVYPENWVIVIGVGIGLIGLRWPFLAYFMAIAVLFYPLYTINLYLAVLFVAVSVLGQRLFVHYMGATVLVLATPLLAKYHLHWLIPILGGLWWGGITGLWVGALAAIWGKFLGGLTGLNTDWLVLAGQVPDVQVLATRFYEANSLETLILLIEPFATTATIILYNLLQIAGWAIAGAFVGTLAQRKWIKYRTPWSILVITAGGGLIMLATHLALPYWLQEALTPAAQAVLQDPTGPLFSLMMVILVGTTVYSLRESLDLPVAPRRARTQWGSAKPVGLLQRTKAALQRRGQSSGTADFEPTRRPIRIPHQSELPEWEPPKDDTGLIMLEID
jgi:hypothetical protein